MSWTSLQINESYILCDKFSLGYVSILAKVLVIGFHSVDQRILLQGEYLQDNPYSWNALCNTV